LENLRTEFKTNTDNLIVGFAIITFFGILYITNSNVSISSIDINIKDTKFKIGTYIYVERTKNPKNEVNVTDNQSTKPIQNIPKVQVQQPPKPTNTFLPPQANKIPISNQPTLKPTIPITATNIAITQPQVSTTTVVNNPTTKDIVNGSWIKAGSGEISFNFPTKTVSDRPTMPIMVNGNIDGLGRFNLPIPSDVLTSNYKIEVNVKDQNGKVHTHDISYIRGLNQGSNVNLNFMSASMPPIQQIQSTTDDDVPPPPPE
jgi:hypothetical protein